MIPLKTSQSIERLPRATWIGLFCFISLSLYARFNIEPWAIHIAGFSMKSLFGLFVFPTFWSLAIGVIFFWVFSPRVFLKRSLVSISLISLAGLFLGAISFSKFQMSPQMPFFLSDGLIGIFLGMFMRGDIWGQINSLVFGIGWARVYEVPSYVLLFFWFFYQLIGQFFLPEPFSELRMIYWIPFFTFCWGFLSESALRLKDAYRATAIE